MSPCAPKENPMLRTIIAIAAGILVAYLVLRIVF